MVRDASHARREVAVVLPCYNVEACLPRALDSVFAQTYTDFHTYAVDDSSLDGTMRVLDTYADRCSFVSQPHAGPGAARNRAIQMSDSPFIAFLDADDEWLPHKLERQIAQLKADPELGLVCSLCALYESGKQSGSTLSVPRMPSSGRLFRYLARNCFVFTPTVVVRRRCLEDAGLFNESLQVSEDFNLWLRIAARWKIALLPEILAINHRRSGSLSAAISSSERLRNGVAALEDVQSCCPDLTTAETRALRAALAERLYCYGSHLLSTGAMGASREKLASVLKLQTLHWRAFAKVLLTLLPAHASEFLGGFRTRAAYGSPRNR
jgi:glycosyltransferase involved in cell wall biosynthesis